MKFARTFITDKPDFIIEELGRNDSSDVPKINIGRIKTHNVKTRFSKY